MGSGNRSDSRSTLVLLTFLTLEAGAALALAVAGAAAAGDDANRAFEIRRALAAELRLTDFALWPDASYCRHPSQADLFAPHAEHPAAPEHFPAGSIVPPLPALGIAAPDIAAGGQADGP